MSTNASLFEPGTTLYENQTINTSVASAGDAYVGSIVELPSKDPSDLNDLKTAKPVLAMICKNNAATALSAGKCVVRDSTTVWPGYVKAQASGTAGDPVVGIVDPLLGSKTVAQGDICYVYFQGLTKVDPPAAGVTSNIAVGEVCFSDGDGGVVTEADISAGYANPIGVALSAATAASTDAFWVDLNVQEGADTNDRPVLADMTAGTGISTGTGTVCEHLIIQGNGLIKTEIFIDLTGLNSGGTAGDIIGKDGETANCHIGQITDAKNGTIACGRITCLETPAGGDPDVDFWGSVTEATGAQDAAIASLTGEAQLINHGDWTVSESAALTAMPGADGYLYMACGAATDADYTAGKFLIELWGV